MGNTIPLDANSEEFSKVLASQWEILSDGKCTKYVNKISQAQFVLKLIDYSKTCQTAYRARQLYSFEENPKITILQISQTHIQILVQDGTEDLKSWLSGQLISKIQALIMFKKVLQGLLKLKKKYGCFYLTKNMVKISKNEKILIWINEKFQYNSIAYKLPQVQGQQTMVSKVCSFFGSLIPPIHPEGVKNINQALVLVNKIMIQKTLSEYDQPYPESNPQKKVYKPNKISKNDSISTSKISKSHKSYRGLVSETVKTTNSPRIFQSISRKIQKNPQQDEIKIKSKQNQPFSLKLNPVSYQSHSQSLPNSQSLPSNYSQSSKTSKNQLKIQNNIYKSRNNDMLFISMGSGQSPKIHSSIADTQQQNLDNKNASHLQILTPLSQKSHSKYSISPLQQEKNQILPQKKRKIPYQNSISLENVSVQDNMKESGQLASPIRRQIQSQLSKLL